MKAYVTIGLAVVAGAALLETALIPGILIGGVAVLAPRYLPTARLRGLRDAGRKGRAATNRREWLSATSE
jgi:hypothetical protein